jgi:hypothetical protein
MNVIIDNLNLLFTGVCNVSLQLLQNQSSYMFAVIISYIQLEKNDTQRLWYCLLRIHRSQQQLSTSTISTFAHLYYLLLWVQNSYLDLCKCKKHNRSLKVAVQGPDFWPTPSTYICKCKHLKTTFSDRCYIEE